LIGAHDLSESQRSTGIAGSDVGVGAFDGSPERRPESFGVIVWKRSEQIVKRRHYRSRCWICSAPSEIPAANYAGARVQTKTSLPVDNVGAVRQKNDFCYGAVMRDRRGLTERLLASRLRFARSRRFEQAQTQANHVLLSRKHLLELHALQ
jgi:hypothetical protein